MKELNQISCVTVSAGSTHSRESWSSLGHFTGGVRASGGFGGLALVSAPPAVCVLLLQVLQTLSDHRAAQLEEEEGHVRAGSGV